MPKKRKKSKLETYDVAKLWKHVKESEGIMQYLVELNDTKGAEIFEQAFTVVLHQMDKAMEALHKSGLKMNTHAPQVWAQLKHISEKAALLPPGKDQDSLIAARKISFADMDMAMEELQALRGLN